MKWPIFIGVLSLSLMSCSVVNKVGTSAMSGIMLQGSGELMREARFENFKQAAIPNLKMLEGLWFADQDNQKLLTLLIKGYAGFAYAVNETEFLEDKIQGLKNSIHKQRAIYHYEKSVYYGVKYLELKGISGEKFWSTSFPNFLKDNSSRLNADDSVAIFYFAQALGGSINLQRKNISKLPYFSHVKALSGWACQINPHLEFGACGQMKGILAASTPRILGGNMEDASKEFKKQIKDYPQNYLSSLNYMQYYLIPMYMEDEFFSMLKIVEGKLKSWSESITSARSAVKVEKPEFNLFNSVAQKRLEIFKKYKKIIF